MGAMMDRLIRALDDSLNEGQATLICMSPDTFREFRKDQDALHALQFDGAGYTFWGVRIERDGKRMGEDFLEVETDRAYVPCKARPYFQPLGSMVEAESFCLSPDRTEQCGCATHRGKRVMVPFDPKNDGPSKEA